MSSPPTLALNEVEARAILKALPPCSACSEPAMLSYGGVLFCAGCAVVARANPLALMLRARVPVTGRPRALPYLAVAFRLQEFLHSLPATGTSGNAR